MPRTFICSTLSQYHLTGQGYLKLLINQYFQFKMPSVQTWRPKHSHRLCWDKTTLCFKSNYFIKVLTACFMIYYLKLTPRLWKFTFPFAGGLKKSLGNIHIFTGPEHYGYSVPDAGSVIWTPRIPIRSPLGLREFSSKTWVCLQPFPFTTGRGCRDSKQPPAKSC